MPFHFSGRAERQNWDTARGKLMYRVGDLTTASRAIRDVCTQWNVLVAWSLPKTLNAGDMLGLQPPDTRLDTSEHLYPGDAVCRVDNVLMVTRGTRQLASLSRWRHQHQSESITTNFVCFGITSRFLAQSCEHINVLKQH